MKEVAVIVGPQSHAARRRVLSSAARPDHWKIQKFGVPRKQHPVAGVDDGFLFFGLNPHALETEFFRRPIHYRLQVEKKIADMDGKNPAGLLEVLEIDGKRFLGQG